MAEFKIKSLKNSKIARVRHIEKWPISKMAANTKQFGAMPSKVICIIDQLHTNQVHMNIN